MPNLKLPSAIKIKPPTMDLALKLWPSHKSDAEVYRFVASLHDPVDLAEGDLSDRIYNNQRYRLEYIPLSTVNANEWSLCEDLARDYANQAGDFPPIVFDQKRKSIIDGTHRVNAALLRGDAYILAYVSSEEQK